MVEQEIIIDVQNLTVGYNDRAILEGITFKVYKGDIFAILDESGSGKSTLLKFIIGLETPMSGSIFIDKTRISEDSETVLQDTLKKIGILLCRGNEFRDEGHIRKNDHGHLQSYSSIKPCLPLFTKSSYTMSQT